MADYILADTAALLSYAIWEEGLARLLRKKQIPAATIKKMPFGKTDACIIVGICLVYGIIALTDLGIRYAPETEYSFEEGEEVVLDLEKASGEGTLNWYLKDYAGCAVRAEFRDSQEEAWREAQEIVLERAFCWGSSSLDYSGRYMRVTNIGEDMAVGELVLQNADGGILTPSNAEDFQELFDEAETFPEVIDYQTGAYFDESYYTRTAYDFLNGEDAYEKTHPPLGKIFIALGVSLFGTTPFGFRIVGVLFGIMMLPFLYLLGKELSRSRLFGAFACFLFAFDFMHFTQTRIATIDVYITFFTILMFYFMYRYSRMSFYDTPLIGTFLPLGLCGISFGLGVACKWTGFYAGAGLALLFFRTLYLRWREYVYASEKPDQSSNGIKHEYIIRHFREYTGKTIAFCAVFFAALPFLIYLLSYLPFSDGTGDGLFVRMWNNQKAMLSFHTSLKADHPYASSWYQWPVMLRPVFYYSKVIDETMRQGISAFGNPLVWWAGIPALYYMIFLWIGKKDKNAAFLCVAYGSCYLPWCFVERCTFAYHYFPCVPLVVCMIMYSFVKIKEYGHIGRRKTAFFLAGYCGAALALFGMFYPVISGNPVSAAYVDKFLRWLDTWVLVL